jgi:hypothetical protein
MNLMSDEEKDDVIVSFMRGQEQDRYCLLLNRDRYDAMLKVIPEGKWRDQIEELHQQTLSRLEQLDSIIAASLPQMPPDERVQAAMARITAKKE